MSQDRVAVMDGSKCIMQLRGVRPFFSDKFDITKHKQYHCYPIMTKEKKFDIEKYVRTITDSTLEDDVVWRVCDVRKRNPANALDIVTRSCCLLNMGTYDMRLSQGV